MIKTLKVISKWCQQIRERNVYVQAMFFKPRLDFMFCDKIIQCIKLIYIKVFKMTFKHLIYQ